VRNTVYDTTVVAFANGDLVGRKANNILDRRLRAIEEFLEGRRIAWYNSKLEGEYSVKVVERRNDVIVAFFLAIVDRGKRAQRNQLTRQAHARALTLGWPSHDQHLLAAALEGTRSTIYVTEKALGVCAKRVKREFDVIVTRL
jgi:hypothetical protein